MNCREYTGTNSTELIEELREVVHEQNKEMRNMLDITKAMQNIIAHLLTKNRMEDREEIFG